MTMPAKDQVAEAVRERVRMADAWSKSTGYPPQDYFDVMMDLRRMLALYDAAQAALRAMTIDRDEADGWGEEWKRIATEKCDRMKEMRAALSGLMSAITYTPSPADGEGKSCRRAETGWCWTHDKLCGEYDASKFCECGYPKDHSGDCHAHAPSPGEDKPAPVDAPKCGKCVEGVIEQRLHPGAWVTKPCPACTPPTGERA
jgi:hypothetical protein